MEFGKVKFEGNYINGIKTGKGKFEYYGDTFVGEFVNGKYHGIGSYFFLLSGKTYTGKFKNNQISGKGAMVWENGTSYAG